MKRYLLVLLAVLPLGLLLGIAIGRETAPQEMREGPEPLGSGNEPGGWAQPRSRDGANRLADRDDIFPDRREQPEAEADSAGFRPDLDYEEEIWPYDYNDEGDYAVADPSPRQPGRMPSNPVRQPAAPPPPEDGLPPIW